MDNTNEVLIIIIPIMFGFITTIGIFYCRKPNSINVEKKSEDVVVIEMTVLPN